MTIEEKAKAYDEALERAKDVKNGPCPHEASIATANYIFPQLAESENERVRKSLIKFLTDIKEISESGRSTWAVRKEDAERCKSFIDYLEKQKNSNDMAFHEGYTLGFNDGMKEKEQKSAEWEWHRHIPSNCIKNCKKCQGKCFYRKEPYEDVERINLGNEFENQVSRILASVLNGEHEYNEGFVKYAAQSLLGYAKQEQKPAEVDEYEIIKKHITDDVLSSEVNKRLKECGWYVTDEKPAGATINGEPIPTENQSIDIPLAEWSEADEMMATSIVNVLKRFEHKGATDMKIAWLQNKLKSFRPQQKDNECISPKEGDIVVNKYGEISVFENWGHHPDGGSFNDKTYFFAKCTLDGDYYDDCDCYSDSDGLRYATPEEIRKIVPYILKPLPLNREEVQPVEGEFPYDTPADTIEGEIENIWKKLSRENMFAATKTGFREVILHFVNYAKNNAASGWSEDDETRLKVITEELERFIMFRNYGTPLSVDDIDWLKNLPERFNLQPKQEWSKDDEKVYTFVYDFFENCWWNETWDISRELVLKTLKSLRLQPHMVSIKNATKFGNLEYERGVRDGIQSEKSRQWKPSDEQLRPLEYAIEYFKKKGNDTTYLESLYNDLQRTNRQ